MHLRNKARVIIGKGIFILFISFLVSALFMPIGILFLFMGLIGVSIYMYSSIANIACPHCHKNYGVGMGFMGNIIVPSKCVCCHTSES